MQEFCGQRRQVLAIHIGRVAENKVVARLAQRRKYIRLDNVHTISQAHSLRVVAGELQRSGVDIEQVHPRLRVIVRNGQADTATAATKVQDPRGRRTAVPGPELVEDQFGKRRARNDRPGITEEFKPGKPGLAQQVGERRVLLDTRTQQRLHTGQGIRGQRVWQHAIIGVQRQFRHRQYQLHCFVPGIISAVTKIGVTVRQRRTAILEGLANRLWMRCHIPFPVARPQV